MTELREFKKQHKMLPTSASDDKTIKRIVNAVLSGLWEQFGIKKWNELLLLTFDEVNKEDKYKGKEGLERAIRELNKFKQDHKQRPTQRDKGMGGIKQAAERGEWSKWEIGSWNDLFMHVFGKVNIKHGKYNGEDGLKQTQEQLQEFKQQHKRLPTTTDKGMSGIRKAIKRGVWSNWGIENWNDLLWLTFKEGSFGKYIGEKGLERAVEVLRMFEKQHRKLPSTADKGMGGIKKAINRGEWADLGIKEWNDILLRALGKVNVKRAKKR
ncbi:MAG: hypothetical protein ACFFC7_22650 [Candidatus Hermodarchaeota archaeon]